MITIDGMYSSGTDVDLKLLNGRERPDEPADDWVFEGPVLREVQSVQQKYRDVTTVAFAGVEATKCARALTGWELWEPGVLEVRWHDDLIETRDSSGGRRYFGDMVLVHRFVNEEAGEISQCVIDAKRSLESAILSLDQRSGFRRGAL